MKKRVLILANHEVYLYNLRKELIYALLDRKYEVYISLPYGKRVDELIKAGCRFIETRYERRSINPLGNLQLLRLYNKTIQQVKPGIVLTYTIKPNIYGGIICGLRKVPYVCNITGLGTAVGNKGLLQTFTLALYRIALRNANRVFFQNQSNRNFFIEKHIAEQNNYLLPGSGINLSSFTPLPYPSDDAVRFVFIGRLMKEKGIEEYFIAAEAIKKKHPNTEFHICGFCEEKYDSQLKKLQDEGIVIYHGMVDDIKEILKNTHTTTTTTTYHEGMSNVILESAASARPVIATDIAGCREAVDDGVSGYLFPAYNTEVLISKMEQFISLTWEQKRDMGIAGRKKMEKEFDRQIVVDAYMKEIEQCLNR